MTSPHPNPNPPNPEQINKLLLKRKHEYAELAKRVKRLERSETKCGEMVTGMNARNLDVAASVEQMQHNLTTHERVSCMPAPLSTSSDRVVRASRVCVVRFCCPLTAPRRGGPTLLEAQSRALC